MASAHERYASMFGLDNSASRAKAQCMDRPGVPHFVSAILFRCIIIGPASA